MKRTLGLGIISVTIAYFFTEVVRALSGFTYHLSEDGFRLIAFLSDLGLWVVFFSFASALLHQVSSREDVRFTGKASSSANWTETLVHGAAKSEPPKQTRKVSVQRSDQQPRS